MKEIIKKWTTVYNELVKLKFNNPKVEKLILISILIFCTIIRLITIKVPQLDRTMWKEIDYLAISENYWKNGFNFFRPEIKWPAEEPRVTAIEFPLVPYITAILYHFFGITPYSVRFITFASFLILIIYVFRLVRKETGSLPGVLAALASAIMPMFNPFGKIIFSEPLMITCSLMAIFYFAKWIESGRIRDWFKSMITFSLAIALKLEPLFILLPLIYLGFRRYKFDLRKYNKIFVLILIGLILPILWYSYAYYLATNYNDVFGVFGGINGGHNKFQTFSMLTDPKWYKIIFGRIHWTILGGKIGVILCTLGFISSIKNRKTHLFYVYLLAVVIYFVIVAEGQIDAPYRQLNIIPTLSFFCSMGALNILALGISILNYKIFFNILSYRKKVIVMTFGILLILSIGIERIKDIFGQDPLRPSDPYKWEIAIIIKQHSTSENKLIVVGEYTIHKGGNDLSPVLYHYSGLKGWTLQKNNWNLEKIDNLINRGGKIFIACSTTREPEIYPLLEEMKKKFKIILEKEDTIIIDLKKE